MDVGRPTFAETTSFQQHKFTKQTICCVTISGANSCPLLPPYCFETETGSLPEITPPNHLTPRIFKIQQNVAEMQPNMPKMILNGSSTAIIQGLKAKCTYH